MAKTYWVVRDYNGLYLCTEKPYWDTLGQFFYIPIGSMVLNEENFPWIEFGKVLEVELILKPVEKISTAQTKAAKKHRLKSKADIFGKQIKEII